MYSQTGRMNEDKKRAIKQVTPSNKMANTVPNNSKFMKNNQRGQVITYEFVIFL
jgi:hypothetical protein